MSASLNISALSGRTGVAPDTLRKWERRYGVLRPERTPGGQRRYTEADVARVEWLRDRIAEGWRIGTAAALLQDTERPPLDQPGELQEALVAACRDGAGREIEAILDQTLAVLPLGEALEDVIGPALRWAGDAWHAGELSIAREHLLSEAIRARLEQLRADPRAPVRGTIVLACGPGELHELGLLMLVVSLRADGWQVEYLGQTTPVADALAFAGQVGASAVCFSLATSTSASRLLAELSTLDDEPATPIVLGGRAATAEVCASAGAQRVNGTLRSNVGALRKLAGA